MTERTTIFETRLQRTDRVVFAEPTPSDGPRRRDGTTIIVVVQGRVTATMGPHGPTNAAAPSVLVVPPRSDWSLAVDAGTELIEFLTPGSGERSVEPGAGADEPTMIDLDAMRAPHDVHERFLVAETPALRIALHLCPPGFTMAGHRHPGDEVFLALSGAVAITLDADVDHLVVPPLHLAPQGSCHALASVGDEPLSLLCLLAPNNRMEDYRACEPAAVAPRRRAGS
jgi:quercetin dioxygenase-like cupin family protein